uniref:Uncharacterized protein n=1 Tax=Hyaloperonospora arabidopsidis (strain Emoy2) TaxID=559515 RepID=M4BN17_HYAAE
MSIATPQSCALLLAPAMIFVLITHFTVHLERSKGGRGGEGIPTYLHSYTRHFRAERNRWDKTRRDRPSLLLT